MHIPTSLEEVTMRALIDARTPPLVRFEPSEVSEPTSRSIASVVKSCAAENRDALSRALERRVNRKAISSACPSIDRRAYSKLPPWQQMIVYWHELDQLVHHARAAAHEAIRQRAVAALNAGGDIASVAVITRQIIEIVYWAAWYQYGVTLAINLVHDSVPRIQRPAFVFSKDIEDFVRGVFAVSAERSENLAMLEGRTPSPSDEHLVSESNPSTVKLSTILEHVAAGLDKHDASTLIKCVERLDRAYHIACGFSHVTPLLLRAALPFPGDSTQATSMQLFVDVLCAASDIVDAVMLDTRFQSSCLLPIIGQVFPRVNELPAKSVEIPFSELQALRLKNKKVEFTHTSGSTTVFKP